MAKMQFLKWLLTLTIPGGVGGGQEEKGGG